MRKAQDHVSAEDIRLSQEFTEHWQFFSIKFLTKFPYDEKGQHRVWPESLILLVGARRFALPPPLHLMLGRI
jgi:hypothetical protein